MDLSRPPRRSGLRERVVTGLSRREQLIVGLSACLGLTAVILAVTARGHVPPDCWVPVHPNLTTAARTAAAATVVPVILAFAWRARTGLEGAVIAICAAAVVLVVVLDPLDCRDLGP